MPTSRRLVSAKPAITPVDNDHHVVILNTKYVSRRLKIPITIDLSENDSDYDSLVCIEDVDVQRRD